ncbi:hypothetical protein [Chryseobacterium wanjuense]
MKKKLILLCSIAAFSISYSQVGVNTENPQGIFHVDGGKDNVSTGIPTVDQQSNDFTVSNTGNVGIGTTTPSKKLDINSPTAGAIKIVDGTQAAGRLLISDSEGIATWQETTGTATIIDSNAGLANTVISSSTLRYTGAQVTIAISGYYIISPRLIFNKTPANCSIYVAYNLSKTPTAPTAADKVFSVQDIHMPASWEVLIIFIHQILDFWKLEPTI